MKKKNLVYALLCIVLVIGIISTISNRKQNIKSIAVINDISTTTSIETMIEEADVIVVGKYQQLESKWNMNRNPNDIKLEDPDQYSEGYLYSFHIKDILKGKDVSQDILVNIKHLDTVSYEQTSFQIVDPLFIEPQTDQTYVLFLKYNQDFDHYYGAIEPFMVTVENDILHLQSNLLIISSFQIKQKVDQIGDVELMINYGGQLEDHISNTHINELKELIYQS